MATTKEKINIIVMRDSGESKRYRMLRSRFRTLKLCCALSPFITAAALAGCYWLWEQNTLLSTANEQLAQKNAAYEISTKRLSHLEALLTRHEDVEKKIAVKIAAQNGEKKLALENTPEEIQKSAVAQEGPGHENFPVIDTGALQVDNVSSTLVEKDRIRTAFDLRNKGTESIAGEAVCILSLASGKTIPLTPAPADAGKYKIANFKSAVMYTEVDSKLDLTNAELILEVKDQTGAVVYRNIYPLSQ